MSEHQLWLNRQSTSFQAGYDAAALGQARDKARAADWLRGFDQYQGDMAASEAAQPV